MSTVPASTQILVIGGGPGGSYAATVLAREGFSVVLLEAAKFPRYHIGESLLPAARHFLRLIDAEDAVAAYGFTYKPGAAVKLTQAKREGYSDFNEIDPRNSTWNVYRADFDELLLRHASKNGRPIAASWVAQSGSEGRISFDYVVDASGRNGIMSTKYLKNRYYIKNLQNVACWGYWENSGVYKPGTVRENAIWVESLTDGSGWTWYIPVNNGSVSVGVVMNQDISSEKRRALREVEGGHPHLLQKYYLDEIKKHAPGLSKLLEGAKLRGMDTSEGIKLASDFSYAATNYAGDHFRLVGDAGGFIDPYFSTGVHIALVGGLSAAVTIAASIRGSVSEDEASRWHSSRVTTTYTRMFLTVLSASKQIRNQSQHVTSGPDCDNYDHAFVVWRAIIQGTVDAGQIFTKDELQEGMLFCGRTLAPTWEEADAVAKLDANIGSTSGLVLGKEELERLFDPNEYEFKVALCEVISRGEQTVTPFTTSFNFSPETHYGLRAVVERGQLGLVPV
ncbi:FAD/NAD(P)-binding domain-containing protein [Amylocystis lapponica]|nr:FAD/NAD(P)-binding domain-containing protein [Amylocystis lapponica]